MADKSTETNPQFKWNFTSFTDYNNNISDCEWTNDTLKQNEFQFSCNNSEIDQIWQTKQTHQTDIKNNSNLNDNDYTYANDKQWCFDLVYGYIERIPLSNKTIIPIEIIQTCYMYVIDKNVKYLIDLLTNMETMKKHLAAINYDYQPNSAIKIDDVSTQAYAIISRILCVQCQIDNLESDEKLKETSIFRDLRKSETCFFEQYYNVIPHLEKLYTYNDWVNQEHLLLHALSGVSRLFSDPIGVKYNLLKCNIFTLSNISEEYKMIERYLTLTADAAYGYSITIENIYKLENVPYSKPFSKWKSNDYRMLLWFGDKITNFADILENGLLIPNEAPDDVFKFGKGIHFSDMCSYAANKCDTSEELNTAFVLLCQVPLDDKITTKYDGRREPDPSTYLTLENKCIVPSGVPLGHVHSSSEYNVYVVHDPSQIKMEYLVQLTFMYQSWDWGQV